MSSHRKHAIRHNSEYLDLEQAATICSVSNKRFAKWLAKGNVPVVEQDGKRMLHSHDLIQHLVGHNIPIPDRLLQGHSEKILFVIADENLSSNITTEVIWALYSLREKKSHIIDFVKFDESTELKIITFTPDRIVILQQDNKDCAVKNSIQKIGERAIPICTLTSKNNGGLDEFLNS